MSKNVILLSLLSILYIKYIVERDEDDDLDGAQFRSFPIQAICGKFITPQSHEMSLLLSRIFFSLQYN